MYIPNPVPEGHTETLQLTVIPQVLAWYIQYQHIYSTDIYSPNCWQHISNTNIYRTVFIPTYIYRCDIIPPWLGKEHSIRVQHPSRTVFIPTYIYGCDIIPLWLGKEHIELRATFEPLTGPQYIVQKLSVWHLLHTTFHNNLTAIICVTFTVYNIS